MTGVDLYEITSPSLMKCDHCGCFTHTCYITDAYDRLCGGCYDKQKGRVKKETNNKGGRT